MTTFLIQRAWEYMQMVSSPERSTFNNHYDELDFLSPSCNLTMEKLKDRKEEDVVIFDYSLSLPDRNLPIEEGDPSSGLSNDEEDDRFFQVSKDMLIESEEFNQTINYAKEPPPTQSRGPRLVIM